MIKNAITCKRCGNTWEQDYCYGPGPLKCGKCGKVAPCSIKGIGKLKVSDLGPRPEQWGWCHHCHKMTQNNLGTACKICATPRQYELGRCPRCNSTPSALIRKTKLYSHYKTVSGAVDSSHCAWQEQHKCLICGKRYWITNTNY